MPLPSCVQIIGGRLQDESVFVTKVKPRSNNLCHTTVTIDARPRQAGRFCFGVKISESWVFYSWPRQRFVLR